MFVDRPKPGTKLPLGLSPHGTRKHTSKLFSVCHGSGIHKTLPAKPHINLAEKLLVRLPHRRCETQAEHGTSLNLHPPSPITHFTHQLLSFFTQARLRKRIHPTSAPPIRGEVSREQKVLMQSPAKVFSYAFLWISHQDFFTKSSTCSTRSISFTNRIKSAWDNTIQLHTLGSHLHPFGYFTYYFQCNAKFNFNTYRRQDTSLV